MLCVVAPLDLAQERGHARRSTCCWAIVGTALMLFVIVGSVYPVPGVSLQHVLPYLFFAYLAVGASLVRDAEKAKSPQTLASIQHDMEG